MWFKNLQVYRLPAKWAITADQLQAFIEKQAFAPSTSLDMQSQGWISPRDNGQLVHAVQGQFLLKLQTEKKLLPASVINQVATAKAAELEEQQGFKPGKRQMRELKEQVTDELLPRAFNVRSVMSVWIDPVNGWLVMDASGPSKAEEALKLLIKAIDKFPLQPLRVNRSPVAAMTDWLSADEAPVNFTVDQDTELRATGEGKATVRYVRHAIEADDVRRHIAGGKQCTRLAMTWADRISFVLTESMALKRIAALDILKESDHAIVKNDEERFDSDFLLMAGEMNKLLGDLIKALSGEADEQSDWVQKSAQADRVAA